MLLLTGVSRDKSYSYQEVVEDGCIDNLINNSRRTNTKHRVVEQQWLLNPLISPFTDRHRIGN
tara:strand:+ start:73379 stop:73567 length:189 start_codon:yes stop_codon:yes gene_type:complete